MLALQEGNMFPVALWDPWMSASSGFPSQMFLRLISPGLWDAGCRVPTLHSSRGSACLVRSFPNASCPAREGGGLQEHVSASPIHLGMVLLTFVVESSSSDFQIFFRGKWCMYVATGLVYPWRRWVQELLSPPSLCPLLLQIFRKWGKSERDGIPGPFWSLIFQVPSLCIQVLRKKVYL